MKTKKRSGIREGNRFATFLMYFACVMIAFITLYPMYYVLILSLSSPQYASTMRVYTIPKGFDLSAYKVLVQNSTMWRAYLNTIVYVLPNTVLMIITSSVVAYGLNYKKLIGRKWLTMFLLIPMYFGGGMIPTFLVVKGVGLYNTLGALFIPQSISVFNFIVMRTFFRELPDSLQDAARIDGASYLQVLFKIILPLSLAVIATIGLFYAVGYWNSYFDALIYIQDGDKYTLQLRLRNMLFGSELGNAADDVGGTVVMPQTLKMATVVVSTLPILVVYPWLQKYFVKGVMLGSVKG